MKKHLVLVLLFLASHIAVAQELRVRTNEVHITSAQSRSQTTVPVIKWIAPLLKFTNSPDRRIEIEADIQSNFPLRDVQIIVGDNLAGAFRVQKDVEVPDNTHSMHLKQAITLITGSNYIEIVAENIDGGTVSDIRQVVVGEDAIAASVSFDRKDYALLFATDKYDFWSDLVNPVYDANTIAKELKEKYGFIVEVVENANQEDILLKIKEYAIRSYKPQDQLFIFFAGHGQFDEGFGEGYVVAKNSLEIDKAKTTYISHSNLRSYVNNISCKHILLGMDVCFGGSLDPAISRQRGTPEGDELSLNEFIARKLSKKTRLYLTSGGKEYVSDGIVGKHSPFASSFLESLQSMGGADQILTVNEILPYLEKIKQHEPRTGDFGYNEKGSDFIFIAKRN
jgi:hypothetical protein